DRGARSAGEVPDQMGQEVPGHLAFVAGQLVASQADVRVAGGDPSSGLYDQRDRVAQLQLEKDHQKPERLPELRFGLPVYLSGAGADQPEVDDADQELESGCGNSLRSSTKIVYR